MLPAIASNATKALQHIREAQQAGAPYRLVLTDCHMPEVDGFVLAEQIKQDSQTTSTVVMMLTSGDHPDDAARCEQAGISSYLLKPVKQSELLEAIEVALGIRSPKARSVSEQVLRPAVGRLRILLAEDSVVNQKLAVALLEREGHTITVVRTGHEAVAAAAATPFDLLLMDVQMPELDGLEATAIIRQQEQKSGKHVPIIAMTAYALKGDRERCIEAGMDAYVSKPIRAEELLQTIAGVLGIQPAEPALPPEAPAGELQSARRGWVNWNEVLAAAGGHKELARTVVAEVLKEIPPMLASIREAIAQGDAKALQLAAHTLNGSIRFFGPTPPCELAYRLEQYGAKAELNDAPSLLQALEKEMQKLALELAGWLHDNEMSAES